MLLLRRIDLYGQMTLGVITGLSTPFYLYFGWLAGLFFIGCWQLISAALNTSCFQRYGLQREIATYWKWTGLILGMIFLSIPLGQFFDPDDLQVLMWLGILASLPVAVHYLSIYSKLIEAMVVKREVGGLIKSKDSL